MNRKQRRQFISELVPSPVYEKTMPYSEGTLMERSFSGESVVLEITGVSSDPDSFIGKVLYSEMDDLPIGYETHFGKGFYHKMKNQDKDALPSYLNAQQ